MTEGPRINILHVVVGIALLLIAGAIIFPVFGGHHHSPKIACMSNLKQLGTSTLIYMSDFDDRYPIKAWQDEIYPYAKYDDLYSCVEIVSEKKSKWGYAMNYEVLGKEVTTPENDAKTPILFETDALAPNVVANVGSRSTTRHKSKQDGIGGSNISFADTHTKFYKAGTPLP